MKWAKEAEEAVARVPFFVRRRVRKRVEEEAERQHAREVALEHVQTCRQKFLKNMEDEVKGHQVETCFGPGGCPNRAVEDSELVKDLEDLLESKNLRKFLKQRVKGPLKLHHEFRVSTSDCPNACSRPQIADLGLIGAVRPRVATAPCTGCGACIEVCKENAIQLSEEDNDPTVNSEKCLACGQCIKVCPAGVLEAETTGYRVVVGGKLGRRPQLARELEGIYSKEEALSVVDRCLDHYLTHCVAGERFGEVLNRTGMEFLESAAEPRKEASSGDRDSFGYSKKRKNSIS
jgi:anaerobic sulfite reductase subunit C